MMKWNKKGQMIILKIMLAIIILIMAMTFIAPLKESIGLSRNTSSSLNCSAPDLSSVTNATCIVLDFAMFYFLGIAISIGMAFIAGKKDVGGVVTAIVVFVVVNILISPLKDFIIYARDATHLNCAGAALSVGSRLTCILFDLWLFWFVVIAISSALTFIFAKKVLSK